MSTPQTWHYGLVAEWWAAFNIDGPEIDYFGRFVAAGQPGRSTPAAARAGCSCPGSGQATTSTAATSRPTWSPAAASGPGREGLEPTLLVRAAARARPAAAATGRSWPAASSGSAVRGPKTRKRYVDSIAASSRTERALLDRRGAVRRLRGAPGRCGRSRRSPDPARSRLPAARRARAAPRTASSTSSRDRVLRERDRSTSRSSFELLGHTDVGRRTARWRRGARLTMRSYFRDELASDATQRGFSQVDVRGGYADEEPDGRPRFLVFIARR